jgi:hypothetical protein
MPRVNDLSYHELLSRPTFFNEEQREEYVQKRIEDTVLEPAIPPLPTRQQELDYLEELENEFRNDRWLHTKWRKLQAGPLRRPYKKTRELAQGTRLVMVFNFLIGAMVVCPAAVFVGRFMRVTPGGVTKIYLPKNYHRFPNVNPDAHARNYFHLGFFGTCFAGGLLSVILLTPDLRRDEYFSRPDFKPSTPMVEDTPDVKKAKEELYLAEYNQETTPIFKKTSFYRLFRPNAADYCIRYKDRSDTDHPGNTYNRTIGAFPSEKRMHEHHWN